VQTTAAATTAAATTTTAITTAMTCHFDQQIHLILSRRLVVRMCQLKGRINLTHL
jgi:hypothetical protein